jgi:hypothetical protein
MNSSSVISILGLLPERVGSEIIPLQPPEINGKYGIVTGNIWVLEALIFLVPTELQRT